MFLLNGNYAPIEDPKHYSLYCPSIAALREKWFASAAQLAGNRWHCASDKKKIDWLLNVFLPMIFDTNVIFFRTSNHFLPFPTVSVNFYSFVYFLFDRHV